MCTRRGVGGSARVAVCERAERRHEGFRPPPAPSCPKRTYLVRSGSNLGGRQQDLEVINPKVADADAPKGQHVSLTISARQSVADAVRQGKAALPIRPSVRPHPLLAYLARPARLRVSILAQAVGISGRARLGWWMRYRSTYLTPSCIHRD